MRNTQRPDTVCVCNCVSGRCKCQSSKNLAVCVGQDATALNCFTSFCFGFVFELLWLWLLFVIVINIIIIMFCKLIPVFHNQYYTFYIIKKVKKSVPCKDERVKKRFNIFYWNQKGILPDFFVNWVSAPKHAFSCYSMLITMYDFLAHDFF